MDFVEIARALRKVSELCFWPTELIMPLVRPQPTHWNQRPQSVRSRRECPLILAALLSLSLPSADCGAAESPESARPPSSVDLAQLSLEELGQIKVTSVSKKSESLSGAAAAIHVITQEDIRRSGVTSLAGALRMAPGLDVAQMNARQWAISARGFNDIFANRLLVLMDGRTLYTPLFSGVFWDEADAVLEDVDRIEVIRGPGGALWGANAVNGVINIITKSAKETPGTLMSAGGGSEERGFGAARYGGRLGTNTFFRVYGKYSDRDEATLTNGAGAGDNWTMSQWGFRVDSEPSPRTRLTLQGDYYLENWGGLIRRHSLSPPGMNADLVRATSEGVNLLGRWTQDFSAASELSIQAYFDRTDREFGLGGEIRNTFDLDAQFRFRLGERHEIIWGAGYRYSLDDVAGSADFSMDDPSVGLQLGSTFVQDEVALIPDRLSLTAGTKLEHNDFTGFEVQPSVRLAWTPDEHHTIWASVSRAVRTPSRAERGVHLFTDPPFFAPPSPLPLLVPGVGNPDFESEELVASEIGLRVSVHPKLSVDLAVFYNIYDRLYSVALLPIELRISPSAQPYLVFPITDGNALYGETYGAEVSALWQPLDHWRLRAQYSFLQMNLHTRGLFPASSEDSERESPRHQASIGSDVDLGRHVEWGVGLRFVDALSAQRISAYTELETRLAWKPTPHCEFSIVGRNLLDAHHQEFLPFLFFSRDVEVGRSVFGKVSFRF